MEGYSVKVISCSKELNVKEKIKLKDTTNAVSLDEITKDGKSAIIAPAYYAELEIHNEKIKDENKDYEKFVIVDKEGTKYVTGSKSFITSFIDIFEELKEADALDDYELSIYKEDSKNYKDKQFLTCSLV